MFNATTCENATRHNQFRASFCARSQFNNEAVNVRHAIVVCLLFVDVLGLIRRLIDLEKAEHAVFLTA